MQIRSTLKTIGARSRVLSALAVATLEIRDNLRLMNPRMTPIPFGFSMAGEVGYTMAREPEIYAAVELMRASDVVIDVGAHAGIYGCIARKLGKMAMFVEPDRSSLRILYHNLRANGWEDSEVWPLACSDRPGIARFFGSGAVASLYRGFANNFGPRQQTVAMNRLDNLVGERFADKQLFIKVDVEGHEYDVLSGATNLLKRAPKPFWFVESFFAMGDQPNEKLRPLFERFWEHGYDAFDAQDKERHRISARDLDGWIASGRDNREGGNWLFLPLREGSPPVESGGQ